MDANGWIPVKEKLPEEDKLVFCWADGKCRIGRRIGNDWIVEGSTIDANRPIRRFQANTITHWQPLPPAPEGER